MKDNNIVPYFSLSKTVATHQTEISFAIHPAYTMHDHGLNPHVINPDSSLLLQTNTITEQQKIKMFCSRTQQEIENMLRRSDIHGARTIFLPHKAEDLRQQIIERIKRIYFDDQNLENDTDTVWIETEAVKKEMMKERRTKVAQSESVLTQVKEVFREAMLGDS